MPLGDRIVHIDIVYCRCLDDEEPSLQHRYTARFPLPPLKVPVSDDINESVESTGYWLSEGDAGPMPVAFSCGSP